MSEKIFCRVKKDRGIYTATVGEQVIKIVDRELYKTEDPKLIEFFSTDKEIEEYDTKENAKVAKAQTGLKIKNIK